VKNQNPIPKAQDENSRYKEQGSRRKNKIQYPKNKRQITGTSHKVKTQKTRNNRSND
jgi:hypothetical protein